MKRSMVLITGLILLMTSVAYAVTIPLGQVQQPTAAIGASGTTSGAIATSGAPLVALDFPATFTGTAVTFTVCNTLAGTYVPLYNSSGAVSYTVGTSRKVAIDPKDFNGVLFFKIVSGSTETGARSIVCTLKGM